MFSLLHRLEAFLWRARQIVGGTVVLMVAWVLQRLGRPIRRTSPFFAHWLKQAGHAVAPPQARSRESYKANLLGTYLFVVLPVFLEATNVERYLPRGLRLQRLATGVGSDKHPAAILFGQQRDLHFPRLPLGLSTVRMTYHEMIVLVPNVQLPTTWYRHTHPGPFVYKIRLDLDHWVPRALGRLVGYPKHRARIEGGAHTFRVNPAVGSIEATCTLTGTDGAPGAFPHFALIEKHLRQPLISRLRPLFVGPGRFVFSNFDWQLAGARMQATRIDLKCELGKLVPPDLNGHHLLSGIDTVAGGAFLLHCPYELLAPIARSKLPLRV